MLRTLGLASGLAFILFTSLGHASDLASSDVILSPDSTCCGVPADLDNFATLAQVVPNRCYYSGSSQNSPQKCCVAMGFHTETEASTTLVYVDELSGIIGYRCGEFVEADIKTTNNQYCCGEALLGKDLNTCCCHGGVSHDEPAQCCGFLGFGDALALPVDALTPYLWWSCKTKSVVTTESGCCGLPADVSEFGILENAAEDRCSAAVGSAEECCERFGYQAYVHGSEALEFNITENPAANNSSPHTVHACLDPPSEFDVRTSAAHGTCCSEGALAGVEGEECIQGFEGSATACCEAQDGALPGVVAHRVDDNLGDDLAWYQCVAVPACNDGSVTGLQVRDGGVCLGPNTFLHANDDGQLSTPNDLHLESSDVILGELGSLREMLAGFGASIDAIHARLDTLEEYHANSATTVPPTTVTTLNP